MFEKAGEYQVVCRYSSEPGDPGLDVSAQKPLQVRLKTWLIGIGSHTTASRVRHESLWCLRGDVRLYENISRH